MQKEYKNIKTLLTKYLDGKTSLEEEKILFEFSKTNKIPEEFENLASEFQHYHEFRKKEPEHISLSDIIEKTNHLNQISNTILFKVAAVVILMLGSFYIGTKAVLKDSNYQNQVVELEHELNGLKNNMAIRLITEESSHDKLQGLLLVSEAKLVSNNIISDILNIYESDTNPIVRSMALEFLKNHVKNEEVKNSMIELLAKDDLIQLQLETVMIIKNLNDKDLLKRLNQLVKNNLMQEKLKVQMIEIL